MGYSLQANSKTREGDQHIDRDAQFQYINTPAKALLATNEPVISVDTKKKELAGNLKTMGENGAAKERLNSSTFTTLPIPSASALCHTASTTSRRLELYDLTNSKKSGLFMDRH
jgi:hypothetical protein